MHIKDLPIKKVYIEAWKKALNNSATYFKHPDWTMGIVTGKEWADECSKALMKRINTRGGIEFKGRKYDSDYQRSILQASIALNTPRLIIDWLPKDLEKRFAYRLRKNMI